MGDPADVQAIVEGLHLVLGWLKDYGMESTYACLVKEAGVNVGLAHLAQHVSLMRVLTDWKRDFLCKFNGMPRIMVAATLIEAHEQVASPDMPNSQQTQMQEYLVGQRPVRRQSSSNSMNPLQSLELLQPAPAMLQFLGVQQQAQQRSQLQPTQDQMLQQQQQQQDRLLIAQHQVPQYQQWQEQLLEQLEQQQQHRHLLVTHQGQQQQQQQEQQHQNHLLVTQQQACQGNAMRPVSHQPAGPTAHAQPPPNQSPAQPTQVMPGNSAPPGLFGVQPTQQQLDQSMGFNPNAVLLHAPAQLTTVHQALLTTTAPGSAAGVANLMPQQGAQGLDPRCAQGPHGSGGATDAAGNAGRRGEGQAVEVWGLKGDEAARCTSQSSSLHQLSDASLAHAAPTDATQTVGQSHQHAPITISQHAPVTIGQQAPFTINLTSATAPLVSQPQVQTLWQTLGTVSLAATPPSQPQLTSAPFPTMGPLAPTKAVEVALKEGHVGNGSASDITSHAALTKLKGNPKPINQVAFLEAITTTPGASTRPLSDIFDFKKPSRNIKPKHASAWLQLTDHQHDAMYALAGCFDVNYLISNIDREVRVAMTSVYGIDKDMFNRWYKNRGRNPSRSLRPKRRHIAVNGTVSESASD